MTYVRVARDQRGYETTMLLYSPRPGDRPRVLYWYRTAPGVRVGRSPLDEEAIRAIEEQHPEIEFDWAQLLEEASNLPPDVERRPERPRRKPSRPQDASPVDTVPTDASTLAGEPPDGGSAIVLEPELVIAAEPAAAASEREAPEPDTPSAPPGLAPSGVNLLLDQLVGREIASRLRARYDEVAARIAALDASDARSAWQARAERLNPDRWSSPEAILAGMQHADTLFDELKRELPP